jgi:hypothetical protein
MAQVYFGIQSQDNHWKIKSSTFKTNWIECVEELKEIVSCNLITQILCSNHHYWNIAQETFKSAEFKISFGINSFMIYNLNLIGIYGVFEFRVWRMSSIVCKFSRIDSKNPYSWDTIGEKEFFNSIKPGSLLLATREQNHPDIINRLKELYEVTIIFNFLDTNYYRIEKPIMIKRAIK